MEDTIVRTYFTTFLMFDENSNIIQKDMCDINEYKSQALRRDDFIKLGFDIKDIDSFYFLISKNNMHLSSNPDGTTTMRALLEKADDAEISMDETSTLTRE